KKLINSPDSCVDEALCGLVRANGGLSLLNGHRVVIRSDLNNLKGKVALLSGGGSGHEPAHGGYVGAGMLSAAVAGGVFASPPPASILSAILSLHNAGASGVLLIVKNYTGDRLNFGLATEQARNHGVAAEMVIVADDCAFELPRKAGRRGLCGTVFIHKVNPDYQLRANFSDIHLHVFLWCTCPLFSEFKIAGALAEEGCSLDQIVLKVTEVLKAIGQNSGGSLSPCSVPCCLPTFDLPPGDMELGLGIHGEPGIKRSKVASADEVVKTMIDLMTNTNSQSHLPLTSGDSVVVCVNNLGALSSLEMAVITRATINSLESRGMVVARVMCGSFMTSLEMAGFSISLMRTNQETLRLFDTKTSAPFWPNLSSTRVSGHSYITEPEATRPQLQDDTPSEGPLSPVLHKVLVRVCSTLLEKQEELNSLDRAAGDGDCGYTHSQAAKAIQEWLQDHTVPACPGKLLSILAGLVQEKMGGSSGALYSLFLTAAAGHLTAGQNGAAAWADAMLAGTQAVKRYGGADTGDRTMLDALCPAADEMRKLVTSPPSGHMSILQAAVQMEFAYSHVVCNWRPDGAAAGLKKVQIPVVCGKCNAALSRVSLVKRNVWTCEFCDCEQRVSSSSTRAHAGHRAAVSDELYLQTENDDDYQNVEDTMVVFCVDISGSMSVTTEVEIYGDGTRAPLTLRDWALVDYDYIWQQGVTYSISHCIAETYDQLKQTVDKLEEHGATSLGPAVLASVAIASKYPGSKVILCTDGRANIGLGKMEDTPSVSSSVPPYFYKHVAQQAVDSGYFPYEDETNHKLVREIGNVTNGLEITFQFAVKPKYVSGKMAYTMSRKLS
ncbi:unnamed protein product, partial [Tetraodon nigroviridis]